MNKDKISVYAHLTVAVLGTLLLSYLFFRHLFFLFLPFLIAWFVAFSVRPAARKISDGTKLPYKAVSVTLTLLILLTGLSVVISACVYALGEAWSFLSGLAENDALYDVLSKLMNPIKNGFFGDREGAAELETHVGEAVAGMLTSLLSSLVGGVTALVTSVPRVLVFVLVTVVSSVYFSFDIDGINARVKKILPKKLSAYLADFKNKFLSTILKYIRAYLILMIITFIIMLFGFLVLGVKYAVLFAFIVASLDALPLIGVGTVIVPWSVYNIAFGDLKLGIGLIVLFAVHTVIRQFIEPKIVGKNLGIHPIFSLVLLYVGYCVFGFFGLLLVPLFSVVLNTLFNKENTSEIP